MKLNLLVNEELLSAAKRVVSSIGVELCESGIPTTDVSGERIGVSLEYGEATIYY